MNDLITLTESAKILDVTIPTISYYLRTGKLAYVQTGQKTAHRKHRRLVCRSSVETLKRAHDEQDARALDAESVR